MAKRPMSLFVVYMCDDDVQLLPECKARIEEMGGVVTNQYSNRLTHVVLSEKVDEKLRKRVQRKVLMKQIELEELEDYVRERAAACEVSLPRVVRRKLQKI